MIQRLSKIMEKDFNKLSIQLVPTAIYSPNFFVFFQSGEWQLAMLSYKCRQYQYVIFSAIIFWGPVCFVLVKDIVRSSKQWVGKALWIILTAKSRNTLMVCRQWVCKICRHNVSRILGFVRIIHSVFCVESVISVHISGAAPADPHLKFYYQQIQLEQNWAVFSWTFAFE